jgi:hypothetical protein
MLPYIKLLALAAGDIHQKLKAAHEHLTKKGWKTKDHTEYKHKDKPGERVYLWDASHSHGPIAEHQFKNPKAKPKRRYMGTDKSKKVPLHKVHELDV